MPCSAKQFEESMLNFTHTYNCNDFDIGFLEKAQTEFFSVMRPEEHL